MSIEENILKKANQKRLLVDVSIEGGNFTTAFFKEVDIMRRFCIPFTIFIHCDVDYLTMFGYIQSASFSNERL